MNLPITSVNNSLSRTFLNPYHYNDGLPITSVKDTLLFEWKKDFYCGERPSNIAAKAHLSFAWRNAAHRISSGENTIFFAFFPSSLQKCGIMEVSKFTKWRLYMAIPIEYYGVYRFKNYAYQNGQVLNA